VRVHYQGRIIPTDSFPSGKIFDASWSNDYDIQTMVPASLVVSGVVDGFATALQNMHIGDRWQVYIPYSLGYDSSASSSIPAYSTLIFDITLVSYYRAGVDVPDWKAKKNGSWVDE
jgi:FKBP-type peptidyl-prolyl cis-trans isomerase FklB